MNVPVIVSTLWTGPNELMISNNATQSVVGNTTINATYTSTLVVRRFQRIHSGVYRCAAKVLFKSSKLSDGNSNSDTITVTVGKRPGTCNTSYLSVTIPLMH